jgi:hypothetical protein
MPMLKGIWQGTTGKLASEIRGDHTHFTLCSRPPSPRLSGLRYEENGGEHGPRPLTPLGSSSVAAGRGGLGSVTRARPVTP